MLVSALLFSSTLLSVANASIFIYPNMGQSPDLQARDVTECKAWTEAQSGCRGNVERVAPQVHAGGETIKGATIGSLFSLILAVPTRGVSVAVGALVGGSVGAGKKTQKNELNREARQIVTATTDAHVAEFRRAAIACMRVHCETNSKIVVSTI